MSTSLWSVFDKLWHFRLPSFGLHRFWPTWTTRYRISLGMWLRVSAEGPSCEVVSPPMASNSLLSDLHLLPTVAALSICLALLGVLLDRGTLGSDTRLCPRAPTSVCLSSTLARATIVSLETLGKPSWTGIFKSHSKPSRMCGETSMTQHKSRSGVPMSASQSRSKQLSAI